jgi:hypothetical protein
MPSSPAGPDSPPKPATERQAEAAAEKLAPEDFYFDGPYLVFTAAYHLKRGSCCNSGCHHCPYGESA